MKWKFVYNTALGSFEDLDSALSLVKKTGYKFFTFNGYVYDLQGNCINITVSELI
jgi:hypothetical protein